jgi:hypothetical protein
MYRDWFMYGLEDLVKPFYKGPPPIHQGHVGEDTLGDAIRNGDFDVVYLVSCKTCHMIVPIYDFLTNPLSPRRECSQAATHHR